jgi:hypothetical protein
MRRFFTKHGAPAIEDWQSTTKQKLFRQYQRVKDPRA